MSSEAAAAASSSSSLSSSPPSSNTTTEGKPPLLDGGLEHSICAPKQWNTVAVWSYPTNLDTCSICKEKTESYCIECQAQMSADVKCPVAWGVCNHAFHMHCLRGWLITHTTCPMCQQPWETDKVTTIEGSG